MGVLDNPHLIPGQDVINIRDAISQIVQTGIGEVARVLVPAIERAASNVLGNVKLTIGPIHVTIDPIEISLKPPAE